jgi:transposase
VTSSYFEGQQNAMACWGYSRDKKSGKKQVVVGLLCDEGGDPVSVAVFTGNTQDYETFGSQVQKAGDRFGCKRVTWVGDRGMIKRAQIKVLKEAQFHYITAITKPQIEKLLRTGIFQMELFDEEVCEVVDEGVRYLLRRNPKRVEEIVGNREGKKKTIESLCQKKNVYLLEHPRAQVTAALNEVRGKMERLKVDRWFKVETEGRRLELKEDAEALAEEARLDGCYVIKSDLPPEIDKQTIHDRYKDLAEVEQAFRTCKTGLLEMRPWYVQLEKSTRGHALVVMLAYLITHALRVAWANFDLTVEEGLKELSMLCSMEMRMKGQGPCHRIPMPRQTSAQLLQAASVRLPHVLPYLGATVVSRKKLPTRRNKH